jgi:1-acyl-sn-glycerol-3-phosphate acyltransferase
MTFVRALRLGLVLAAFLALAPAQAAALRLAPRLAGRIQGLFCRLCARCVNLEVVVEGVPANARPLLVVANHVSWTDVLTLGAAAAPVCFLAKSEVAGWPALGWFARVQRTLFVPRGVRRAIPAVNRAMAERMAAGEPVVLFAEATTGDGNRLRRFHAPHFAACRDLLADRPQLGAVFIQPVALSYVARDGLPLGWAERLDVAWTGDVAFLPHLFSLLAGGRIICRVAFGAPIPFRPGDDRKAAARLCAARVRALRAPRRAGDEATILTGAQSA